MRKAVCCLHGIDNHPQTFVRNFKLIMHVPNMIDILAKKYIRGLRKMNCIQQSAAYWFLYVLINEIRIDGNSSELIQ